MVGIGLGLIIILLFVSISFNISLVYPLLVGLFLLLLIGKRKGYGLKSLIKMSFDGGKKSVGVIKIFFLIGAITALWMGDGTIPYIIYYGSSFINPQLFLICAFLLSCLVSFILGTLFGTVGTIGITLMVMARSGNVNVNMVGGAIIAGAMFGDRFSLMSSSANLVATLTNTKLSKNMKNMLKTMIIPFLLSIIFYSVLSFFNPLQSINHEINQQIEQTFLLSPIVLIPAISIFALLFFKVSVKKSMFVSILLAFLLSIFYQQMSFVETLKTMIFGFNLPCVEGTCPPLSTIIQGGGLVSMIKSSLIILISSCYSGIFEGTKMLKGVEERIHRIAVKYGRMTATYIATIVSSIFGTSQTLAVILTDQLIKKEYEGENELLAVTLENTAILIPGIIPVNICCSVPMATLGLSIAFIPFSFFTYMVPLTYFFTYQFFKISKHS